MPTKLPDTITSFQINMSDAAAQRPTLALEASRIFAKWANVEFVLASTAGMIIGDTTALAILDQIKAKNAHYDAIKIAIRDRIKDDDTISLLSPLFNLLKKASTPRNKLAHSMWGTIEELPQELLLVDHKSAIKVSRFVLHKNGDQRTWIDSDNITTLERKFDTDNDYALEIINVLRDGTEVWIHDDFNEPLRLLDNSIVALQYFTTAISSSSDDSIKTNSRSELRRILVDCGIKV